MHVEGGLAPFVPGTPATFAQVPPAAAAQLPGAANVLAPPGMAPAAPPPAGPANLPPAAPNRAPGGCAPNYAPQIPPCDASGNPLPNARTLEEELQVAQAALQQQAQRLEKLKRLQKLQAHLEQAKEEFERELQREELSKRLEEPAAVDDEAGDGLPQREEMVPAHYESQFQSRRGTSSRQATPAPESLPVELRNSVPDKIGYVKLNDVPRPRNERRGPASSNVLIGNR
jgi:hypothetical protein